MQNSGIIGRFYVIADWIYKFSFANIFWMVCNIPIIFILINLLLADEIGVIGVLFGSILLLSPFVFFPSTVALFSIVNQFIRKEDINLWRDFWRFYRVNFKKSMKLGVIFTVFWAVLIIDFFYVVKLDNGILSYVFIVLGFFALVYNLHVFSAAVNIDSNVQSLLKQVAVIMFGHPLLSMSLGLLSITFFYVMTQWLTYLIPLFSGSIIVFIALLVFIKLQTSSIKIKKH
ncbi:YesL family protein [Gracilibacillus sp. HCP3S3_G5_1]|uniref:YesL family protein n=1 Tax=unclassified Gracilibacillus TaxID=2625209 RepID=UPI003F8B7218